MENVNLRTKKYNAWGIFMTKYLKVAFLIGLFLTNGSIAWGQKKMPPYMDVKRPNFHKIQKKTERYFKKKSLKQPTNEEESDSIAEAFIEGGREEDSEYHRYKRWEWFWQQYSYPDGSFPTAEENFKVYKKELLKNKSAKVTALPNWQSMGPTANSGGYWGMGRCRSVAVSNDPNIYYVGSAGGGVWKTTNRGGSYTPLGDDLPSMGINRVRVVPSNPNIAYAAITETDNYFFSPNLGLYKTTDGGNTWTPTGLNSNTVNGLYINYFVINPSNPEIVIVSTRNGIYRSQNGGNTFTRVMSGDFYQVHLHPTNPQVVYANSNDVYKSTDGGVNWFKITNFNRCPSCYRMGVTAADPDRLYVGFQINGENGDLYVSDNQGGNFYKSGTYYHTQLFYVSQTNKDWVYSGWVTLSQSKNAGASWNEITNWCCGNSNGKTEVHADFWEGCADPSNKNIIYFTNDGGVDRYNEYNNTWEEVSNGLAVRQYYEIGASQQNYNVVVGGSQDNGGSRRQANGNWKNTNGGDGTMALIDPSNDNIMYTQYINGEGITRSTTGWSGGEVNITNNIINAGAQTPANWQTPFHIHRANPAILVAGYKDIYITYNRGDSWSKISQNLFGGNNVGEVAISPSNADVIYASEWNRFRRTYDRGATWQYYDGPAWGNINDIQVHPTNSQIVYIAMSGGDGRVVYRSNNGGETWTNLSAGIPNNMVAACLEYEAGSDEGLYVGTSIGVYYKNASMPSFEFYGQGLPNTYINDIDISYANGGKVIVGTHGRGVWSCDLYESSNVFREPDNPANVENGLLYSYYEGEFNSLPVFDNITPEYLDRAIDNVTLDFTHAEDFYAVRYSGYIDVPEDDEYTFYLNSDDGSKLYIGNYLVIDNDGLHGVVEEEGKIKLKAGKHAFTIEYLEYNYGQAIEFLYASSTISKQLVPNGVVYRTRLRDPDNPAGFITRGVDYKYYEYAENEYDALPDFDALQEVSSGKILDFSLDVPGRRQDFFLVRYEGYIDVPEDGLYHFYTASDDGTKLYIGDQLVVNNDGLHGVVEKQGAIGLHAGRHEITLDYMEYNLGNELLVSFRGPATDLVTQVVITKEDLIRVIPEMCTVSGELLSGTVIGTEGSWNDLGDTRDKVFDDDENTFFDAQELQAWAGLDLGELKTVTEIRYHPRKNFEQRMAGGKFQGSNYADFSKGVVDLYTITENKPWDWHCVPDVAAHKVRYVRYLSPENGHGNVAELVFFGEEAVNENPTATLTSPENGSNFSFPTTITLQVTASDADGIIDKVVFYAEGEIIGEVTTGPYELEWEVPQDGVFQVYAIVYDDAGGSATTETSMITASRITPLRPEEVKDYLMLYPVPFDEHFTLLLKQRAASMNLVDETGKAVQNWGNLSQGQEIVYGEHLAAGQYTLIIHFADGKAYARKIVKQ